MSCPAAHKAVGGMGVTQDVFGCHRGDLISLIIWVYAVSTCQRLVTYARMGTFCQTSVEGVKGSMELLTSISSN